MNKDTILYIENKGLISVNYAVAIDILTEAGIYRYTPEGNSNGQAIFVQVKDGKLHVIGKPEMKKVLKDWTKANYPKQANRYLDKLYKTSNNLFSGPLEHLPIYEGKPLRDDKSRSFLFFKNGCVKVASTGVAVKPYTDIKGAVWHQQILNRDFKVLSEGSEPGKYTCEFEQFIAYVCNGDNNRKKSLESIIGYLLHTYKDPAVPKAVILLDEQDLKSPKRADGRTGKGIIMQAIGHFRKVTKEDGKLFRAKSNFVFQQVGIDTQVLLFDDVGRDLNFEQLFSVISEGIPVEKKYHDKLTIPYSQSPKVVITANHTITGSGHSHEGRRIEFELSHHYNNKHLPVIDFGHRLFDDWAEAEWNRFDNYMIGLLQRYLKAGLVSVPVVDVEFKRLAEMTSGAFAQFCKAMDLQGKELDIKDLYDKFKNSNPAEQVTQHMFTRWLQEYASAFGLKFNYRKSSGKTMVRFHE